MKYCQVLPLVLMVIDFAAAVGYISTGDYRRVIYWIAAGILTWSVTF